MKYISGPPKIRAATTLARKESCSLVCCSAPIPHYDAADLSGLTNYAEIFEILLKIEIVWGCLQVIAGLLATMPARKAVCGYCQAALESQAANADQSEPAR